jgi:glycosyltransferase involved in cell wall biosynthesis
MMVNWDVYKEKAVKEVMQSANILLSDQKYWFFKYWLDDVQVDVIDYSKIPFFHTIEKKVFRFYIIQALKSLPSLHCYDAIISHGAQSAVLIAFIRSIFGKKLPPHIIIDVGCLNGGRSKQPELLLFQQAMKSVSGIIYHAIVQQQHYEKHFPYLIGKTAFVPFGVDSEFFRPLSVPSQDYILSFGYRFRDWETLITAYSKIKTNVMLKIIGPIKISGKIKNITSQPVVSISELKDQIARSRFVVVPLVDLTYAHGQMTFLQSMAMGKAIIVTKVGATIDYVKNLENGLTVKLFDVQDMKDKIEYLLNNDREVERLQINARASVEKMFNERSMAEGIYNALQQFGVSR